MLSAITVLAIDEMIRVFRTNQKMEVHEARSRCHIGPHLDIR